MDDLSIEDIITGIVSAALWADLQWPEDHPKGGDNGESGGGEAEYNIFDVTDSSIAKLRTLCYEFVATNMTDVASYVRLCLEGQRFPYDPTEGSPLEYLGHDIWLTACGHGTGFWDRGLDELGERLTAAAKHHFGRFESSALPYVTTDNKISFK